MKKWELKFIAVAQFERDLLIERTRSGLSRAKRQEKTLGRPKTLSQAQRVQVIQCLQEGKAIAAVARDFDTSRQTIMRIKSSNFLLVHSD